MQTFNILLIDDEKSYCETFKTNAYLIGQDTFGVDVRVTDRQNWEEGAALLQEDYFHALILDAKCMVDKEQETESFDFLTIALDRLRGIERDQNRHIPFAVNTGYLGERETEQMTRLIKERKAKIFSKTTPKEDLIVYLVQAIEETPDTKIEREFADVFEVFDKGFLNASVRKDLLNIIKKLEDKTTVKSNFNSLRKILEEIYQAVKAKNTTLIPDAVFYNRNGVDINLDWTQRYLSGQKVTIPPPPNRNGDHYQTSALMPFHISWAAKYTEETGSKISHTYSEIVTIHAYKSAVFSLLEILIWFKSFMEKP